MPTPDPYCDPMNHKLFMQSFVLDLNTEGQGLEPFILEKWQQHVTLIYACTIAFKHAKQTPPKLSTIDLKRPCEPYLTGQVSACWS